MNKTPKYFPMPIQGGGGGDVTKEWVQGYVSTAITPISQDVQQANQTANQANQTANEAEEEASDAKDAANNAVTKANAADTKADNAFALADQAKDLADEANQTAEDALATAQNNQVFAQINGSKKPVNKLIAAGDTDFSISGTDLTISSTGGGSDLTPEEVRVLSAEVFDNKIIPTEQALDFLGEAVDNAQNTADDALSEAQDASSDALAAQKSADKAETDAQTGITKAGNAQKTADAAALTAGAAVAGVEALNKKTDTTNTNLNKINLNTIVDGGTPVNSKINPVDMSLTSSITTPPTPVATTGIQYWNFGGTPIISFDNSIIPSVSNFVQTSPFPSKEMNITMKIVNGFASTTKYILVNTCVASKDTISTEEKKLISGSFADIGDDTAIFNYLVSKTDPSSNPTQMDIKWMVPPDTNSRGIQYDFTRSSFSALGNMNGVANYFQTRLRTGNFSELKDCIVTWNTNTKQLIFFLNNGISYFTYSSSNFNYPFNTALRLNLDADPKPVIGNPITIGLTSVVSPTKKLARPSYQTNDSVNMISVDTGFCTFRFDVSQIKATPTMVKNNQVVIKITAPSYTAVQVANPNQYFNRYASNIGSDSSKWMETTYKILDQGDITNSPQIVAEYSNNELNGTAERNLVELTLNYAQWQQNTAQWESLYIPTYKSVIAPLNNYTLRVIVIADDGIVPSPYTVNGAKTFTYEFAIQTSWYKNGQILTPFIIQCDNNNIQLLAYDLPITTIGSEFGGYAGKTDGQSNLALGLDALVTGYKIMPEISECNGVSQDIQTIDGLDYYLFTLQAGNIYNLIVNGYVAFSTYFDSSTNPLLVGLINVNDKTNIYATPVQCKVAFDKRHKVNKNKSVIQIDLSNTTEDQVFRFLMSTANGVSGCRAIIYDSIVLNFKSN